jgi:hypothetical protein
MTHPCTNLVTRQPALSKVAVILGLLIFGSQVTVTQAQLSPCTPLQQERGDTSCESPRESRKPLFDTLKGWFGFSSEEPKRESLRGLEPLPKPSFKNDPYELGPIAKPSQPPLNGVRDYLNRQDPAHAIYPIEPVTPRLSSPP